MEQQIFKTNPVKRILIYLFSFVAVFIFTSIFLTDGRFSFLYWAINIFTFAVCFLLVIFETDTTIICDESGCKVRNKSLWNRSAENYDFKWSEVSGTEYFADGETAREFYVETKSVKRKLMTSDFSFDDLDSFIETVNRATPHLPYFWEKNDGWVSSTFEGRRYDKVAR